MESIKQISELKVKNINKQLKNTKIVACNMYYFIGKNSGAYCDLYNRSNKKRIKINLSNEINLSELINNLKN